MAGRMPFLMRMFSETITLRVSWVWKCSTVDDSGGLNVVIDKRIDMDVSGLSSIENIVFAVEE